MKIQQKIDNDRITAAIEFLIRNYRNHPKLGEVANYVHLSPFHFQRMFHEWVGVTPKQFAQYLSVEHAKKILKETHATLFDVADEVGLSTTSRLHDLFTHIEGMTPGEYKNGGQRLTINYSFADTLFGMVIIGSTDKGVCHMAFADEGEYEAVERMKSLLPNATYRLFTDRNQQNALFIFTRDWSKPDEIKLHLKGTVFQLKIWQTLLQIPTGSLVSYSNLAIKAGYTGAQRAVGSALCNNPVVMLIPCHRVIQSSGIIGNYRYGAIRKNAIIGWEAAIQNKEEDLNISPSVVFL